MRDGKQNRFLGWLFLSGCLSLGVATPGQGSEITLEEKLDGPWLSPALLDQAQMLCAEESIDEVLWVDGQLHASCAHAFGDEELREQNRLERLQRVLRIRTSGRSTDIVYRDSKLREPVMRTLEGIHIDRREEAHVARLDCRDIASFDSSANGETTGAERPERLASPAAETIAWAYLAKPFDAFCSAGPFPLRQDDALGAEGQMLHLGRTGALALYRGELLWVPYREEIKHPAIRMIWRADFQVIYEQPVKKSRSSTKKKKKKSKSKRKRRR